MIGERKRRNEPTDVNVLDTLVRCGALLSERLDRYFVFFKSGFGTVKDLSQIG